MGSLPNVIKRDGSEVKFDSSKIYNAIKKANNEVLDNDKLSDSQIEEITNEVISWAFKSLHAIGVEDIQDMVEITIMKHGGYSVAQKYVRYRYKRELIRGTSSIDKNIMSLICRNNEELKTENANKNPTIISTQRDYMAGEVSKDISRRLILTQEMVDAHDNGIVHVHDTDYLVQPMINCCLVNLEDMLQNGTVITGTLIEKPKSFLTACNIATQVIAVVCSNQFGGQTFSLAHLAPFVDVSRQKIKKQIIRERYLCGEVLDDTIIDKVTNMRLKEIIKTGIQIIQYQLTTLMTTNG